MSVSSEEKSASLRASLKVLLGNSGPVSYTHLTLPTTERV